MKLDSKLIKIETHKVPQLLDRIRLSDYAPGIFKSIFSKKGVKKAIKKGFVTINDDIGFTSDYIIGGETIDLYQPNITNNKPTVKLSLDIIFEDDYLAIINKPAGIIVSGNKKYTLENGLPNVLTKSSQKDALLRPEPIHRLDYPTSGALLIGKTTQAVILLNKMFEERVIIKTYHAITIGKISDNGIIEASIENKACKSEYRTIYRLDSRKYESLNLVELIPHTGRRHQLRIHLASIGTSIFGDLKYGEEGLTGKGNGLYLHASTLVFSHPITNKEVSISIQLPKKFLKLFPEAIN